MKFHLITNGNNEKDLTIQILTKVHDDIEVVHIREKNLSAFELVEWIKDMNKAGIPSEKIIINDRADVAVASGVGGVHLTEKSLTPDLVKRTLPDLVVGQSIHSIEGARWAERKGADYVYYGHIYESDSKPNIPPKGTYSLSKVVNNLTIPVIGIGGITPDKVNAIQETGAAGIAILSAIWESNDSKETIKKYLKGWK
ncbi:thiamine phosphate synthase [Pontibacillus yanchengensis]|uniref:Transcriptional regulator n=1 Tax=Pontibacillus yanchengensis Y32 TaxID=1385514 RepID=A0A0A2TA66_9BACI|nr:thiamine phosphate synthase [Pontibacillus yanchengensis]KGP70966.1 transcriptional regulator [Pontibacillus yanchengensis Y32]